jgi:hypothetical protein
MKALAWRFVPNAHSANISIQIGYSMKIVQLVVAAILSVFLIACGGGGGGESSPNNEITFMVTDADNSAAIEGAELVIAGQTLTTDALGEAMIALPNGEYSVTTSHVDYQNTTQTVTVAGADQQVDVALTAVPAGDNNLYIYHSTITENTSFKFWGDTWGSGTVTTDGTDPSYPEILVMTSGNTWGAPFAVIAWGNDVAAELIDISGFTHLSFKVKETAFSNVEVVVQSETQAESKIAYSLDNGTPLGNGWVEMEVAVPAFTDMTWTALMFPGDGVVEVTDVYFTTKEVVLSKPSTAAPTPPPLANHEAYVIFSDYLVQDKYVSVWNSNWWNAPVYSAGVIAGDNYARYEITDGGTNGGVTGLEFGIENGPANASAHTNLNFDLYVESGITQVQVKLVSEDGEAIFDISAPTTDAWVSFDIPFADMQTTAGALNPGNLTMMGIQMWGAAGKALFFDNFYFSGQATTYNLTVSVIDENGAAISGANVEVGAQSGQTDQAGQVVLSLPEGTQLVRATKDGFGSVNQSVTISGADTATSVTLELLNPGPTVAAPAPTISNADAFALYSDALVIDKPISSWWDNWWNAPEFSEVLVAGNKTAKLQIIPAGVAGGVVGIQYGIEGGAVDGSAMTGLHFDIFITSDITAVEFQIVSAGGNAVYRMNTPVTDQWVTVELEFDARDNAGAAFNKAELTQLGVQLWGTTKDAVYMDNLYFY